MRGRYWFVCLFTCSPDEDIAQNAAQCAQSSPNGYTETTFDRIACKKEQWSQKAGSSKHSSCKTPPEKILNECRKGTADERDNQRNTHGCSKQRRSGKVIEQTLFCQNRQGIECHRVSYQKKQDHYSISCYVYMCCFQFVCPFDWWPNACIVRPCQRRVRQDEAETTTKPLWRASMSKLPHAGMVSTNALLAHVC
jgi:hypothetical protein